jgi:hypothetical protein
MLTVYLSADVVVERSAKTAVSGAGEAGPDAVGEGEEDGSDELLALAERDVLALDPGALHPAMRSATATKDVTCFTGGIIYPNEFLRIGLRFRYDPASEAGPDPHPQSSARRGTRRTAPAVRFVLCGWRNSKNTEFGRGNVSSRLRS